MLSARRKLDWLFHFFFPLLCVPCRGRTVASLTFLSRPIQLALHLFFCQANKSVPLSLYIVSLRVLGVCFIFFSFAEPKLPKFLFAPMQSYVSLLCRHSTLSFLTLQRPNMIRPSPSCSSISVFNSVPDVSFFSFLSFLKTLSFLDARVFPKLGTKEKVTASFYGRVLG